MITVKTTKTNSMSSRKTTSKALTKIAQGKTTAETSRRITAVASKKIVTATSKGKTKEYMIKPARNVPIPKTSKKIGTSTTGKLTTSKLATQKGQRTDTKMTTAKATKTFSTSSRKTTAKASAKIVHAKTAAVTSSKTTAQASKKIATATPKGTTKANLIKPARKVPIAKTSQKIETNTTGKSTLNKQATQNGHTINMSTKITPSKSTFVNLKEQHPGQRQVFALLSLKRKRNQIFC